MTITESKTTTCPSWCTGAMHRDGEPDHDGPIGGGSPAGLVRVDLMHRHDWDEPRVIVWLDGNACESELAASPSAMRDIATAFTDAADRLEDLKVESLDVAALWRGTVNDVQKVSAERGVSVSAVVRRMERTRDNA